MTPSRRQPPGPEWVRAWKPVVAGVHEVFHARFVDYAYPPHVHDAWTVFVVDDGWIRYDLETRHRGAGGERVFILPPNVVHDGRAGAHGGFRKRVLYLSTEVLDERLTGPAVDRPDIAEPALRLAIYGLHRALGHPDDALEAESRLAIVGDRLRAHLTPAPDGSGPGGRLCANPPGAGGILGATPPGAGPGFGGRWGASQPGFGASPRGLAGDLRDLLDERLYERTTLGQAGARLGASPSHLVRSFTGTFGIAPHQYVTARRIEAARRRLLDGEPIALVAATVGFYDQAHFSRQFKRHVGIAPGRYAVSGAS
ncbi:MAG TPA: AraC family transcriptional regulator [Acidimicrobiales bacterium]|jgi:AraC-like DNA-binding protein